MAIKFTESGITIYRGVAYREGFVSRLRDMLHYQHKKNIVAILVSFAIFVGLSVAFVGAVVSEQHELIILALFMAVVIALLVMLMRIQRGFEKIGSRWESHIANWFFFAGEYDNIPLRWMNQWDALPNRDAAEEAIKDQVAHWERNEVLVKLMATSAWDVQRSYYGVLAKLMDAYSKTVSRTVMGMNLRYESRPAAWLALFIEETLPVEQWDNDGIDIYEALNHHLSGTKAEVIAHAVENDIDPGLMDSLQGLQAVKN